MLEKYFTQLEASLNAKLNAKPTARRKFVYEIARIGSRIFNDNWSIGWTTVFVPYEILTSMGVSGMFIEFFGAMLAGTGMSSKYLELSESKGFSTDSCSYHRTIIGAAMDGLLPKPDVLIGASIPCNGGVKALKRMGEIFNKEVFILNIPIEVTPKSIDYLTEQFEQMIEYVENQTGRKLDYDKLKKSIKYNNQAREYLIEINDLCKNIPSPANSNDLKNFIIIVLLQGTKESVEVAKLYRDEFKFRVDLSIPYGEYSLRVDFNGAIRDYTGPVFIDLNNYMMSNISESKPLNISAGTAIMNGYYDAYSSEEDVWYVGEVVKIYGTLLYDNGSAVVNAMMNITLEDPYGNVLIHNNTEYTDISGNFYVEITIEEEGWDPEKIFASSIINNNFIIDTIKTELPRD